jgi:hypothetical protein
LGDRDGMFSRAVGQVGIKGLHQLLGCRITHLPERSDDGVCPGINEGLGNTSKSFVMSIAIFSSMALK